MKMSNRMNNIIGLLLVIVALGIQSWMSIFHLATDDFNDARMIWYYVALILLFPGSVLLATTNINRLFAIYHRINYAIAMIGFIGLSILLVFRTDLESLLFPRTMIVYIMILDLLWIFFLGLLLKGFMKKLGNTASPTN